jgi:AraC family transcriptional regulator
MRVEIHSPESATEPRFWVEHQPALAMALRSGSIEIGLHRSKMKRFMYSTGEMRLSPHHLEKWFRTDDLHVVMLTISDTALVAAAGETSDKVELRSIDNLVDARLGALAAAINAERSAGFPSGRLFLDSIEQAVAVALVNSYAVHDRSLGMYRGGLSPTRLRRVKEFVARRWKTS